MYGLQSFSNLLEECLILIVHLTLIDVHVGMRQHFLILCDSDLPVLEVEICIVSVEESIAKEELVHVFDGFDVEVASVSLVLVSLDASLHVDVLVNFVDLRSDVDLQGWKLVVVLDDAAKKGKLVGVLLEIETTDVAFGVELFQDLFLVLVWDGDAGVSCIEQS